MDTPPPDTENTTTTTATTSNATSTKVSFESTSLTLSDLPNVQVADGHLRLELALPRAVDESRLTVPGSAGRKHMIVVMVDKSGSMYHVWNQVQCILQTLFTIVFNQTADIVLEVIFFNDTAYRMAWTPENYKQLIMEERANGKTCFASLFGLAGDLLRTHFKKNTEFRSDLFYDPRTDVSMVLLTDGAHTTNRDHKKEFANLRALIKSITNAEITVHTMGFTENSRFQDLDGIRKLLGNKEGIYQYAEPGDGPHALHEKLNFIFSFILTTGKTVPAVISWSPDSGLVFVESGTNSIKTTLVFDNDGEYDITFAVARMPLATDLVMPSHYALTVQMDDSPALHTTSITPILKKLSNELLTQYKLQRLQVKLNNLFSRVSTHGKDNTPNEETKEVYRREILAIQSGLNEVDNTVIFSFGKQARGEITELKVSCLKQTSQLLELINTWFKSEWTTKTSARMADITYQFMFKNEGRQRRATFKIARNAAAMMKDATQLKQVEVDLDYFDAIKDAKQLDLLEKSKNLFSCTLSLCNWIELAEEKDILGFGLSIQRPETVIDDPTQVRIIDFSTTFLGKSSIEDAIALSIHSVGQDKTTGGFEVGRDKVSAASQGSWS
ncbi:hypothetical protein SAMD00019534_015770 [Acytostelium subglobosum LB1]|uniref:hypothetical protein n=1 Tax=Acytostelium subglobosum LB1 TaxID=1410327 RepID=UPI000644E275|nr:hypothetical protein SAMD00019534_015770 [Acytostelium subglobosum LB1]GAM18402.1 hypothetical protein SAMD00019534_015770 [Acytostelium subglobosum LB1]|eukprot:XP_012757622.1 hypothetical protein SAMD00019534_015770 [Acytostelium subglobosum LB1]